MTKQLNPIELWGGVECTINRVGDSYIEQLDRSGHTHRLSDFNLFAQLGVKAIRHPVLWERTAPGEDTSPPDWTWSHAALNRLRSLGIRPIVGLVHHGSGPIHTNLLDQDFPDKLSQYARKVAERYPWIHDYSPVNEPLTTARFSGLYGHWYPHGRKDCLFVRALVTQCRAIVAAMKSIRQVNPNARLIQTEDLGRVCSTPQLAYQADFENERRWLSYDLLCGRVDHHHPMRGYLNEAGIQNEELDWFLEEPCPPAIVGINHYLSSNRYLDEHLDRYPTSTHGGNGRQKYADVLAARVLDASQRIGVASLLEEAWQRYRLPIAITECHNGCTREEQLRWFSEVWQEAELARDHGVNVVAVTAWALLGAFDWNHLVTQDNGFYEPGVFDIRSAPPRPTALTKLIHNFASGHDFPHPLLKVPGWWKRSERFIYGIRVDEAGNTLPVRTQTYTVNGRDNHIRPVLITGGRGTLARAFARLCELRGIPYCSQLRSELDIADAKQVRRALFKYRPWALINTAGYVRVDEAENDYQACFRENCEGAALLAEECSKHDIQFLTFSSDLVFDGLTSRPYVERDQVSPVNNYGMSKAEAEKQVLQRMPDALVIRTSAFFGPWDEYNFVSMALRALKADQVFWASDDTLISPTYIPDLVNACLDLLIDNESGIWHVATPGETSWADLAAQAADLSGVYTGELCRCKFDDLGLVAKRPRYSVLHSERGVLLPPLGDALVRYVRELECALGPALIAA
jgi:dTDP-4-dehydrorhamnose reductase